MCRARPSSSLTPKPSWGGEAQDADFADLLVVIDLQGGLPGVLQPIGF